MDKIIKIYKTLLSSYGPQGWWPLLDCKGTNPTKTGSIKGYHPGDYSYPRNDKQRFEICLGAILTQNTAWPNVEKALVGLKKLKAIDAKKILLMDEERLKNVIRPAGYYNQKAKKLKIFSEFYLSLKGRIPTREELLSVWGVGRETADSMLLYGYKVPNFVVDAYTKRIFSRVGYLSEKQQYDKVLDLFEKNLPKDQKIYQEFHALIVEHAKRHCSKNPNCLKCLIKKPCKFAKPIILYKENSE